MCISSLPITRMLQDCVRARANFSKFVYALFHTFRSMKYVLLAQILATEVFLSKQEWTCEQAGRFFSLLTFPYNVCVSKLSEIWTAEERSIHFRCEKQHGANVIICAVQLLRLEMYDLTS